MIGLLFILCVLTIIVVGFKLYKLVPTGEEAPLCTGCKWATSPGDEFGRCSCPRLGTELDTGKVKRTYASIARGFYGPFTDCGPRGDWFEPRSDATPKA